MLRSKRGEFASLQGWMGPRRLEGEHAHARTHARADAWHVRHQCTASRRRHSYMGSWICCVHSFMCIHSCAAHWPNTTHRRCERLSCRHVCPPAWLPTHVHADLPAFQLPDSHPDPRVTEGLARVKALDSELNEKTVQAIISHRETFPDQARTACVRAPHARACMWRARAGGGGACQ